MRVTKGNGLDAANDQPAKTLTKHTNDFIAARRAWMAIISVAQRHAIDVILLAHSVTLLLVLAGVLGGVK